MLQQGAEGCSHSGDGKKLLEHSVGCKKNWDGGKYFACAMAWGSCVRLILRLGLELGCYPFLVCVFNSVMPLHGADPLLRESCICAGSFSGAEPTSYRGINQKLQWGHPLLKYPWQGYWTLALSIFSLIGGSCCLSYDCNLCFTISNSHWNPIETVLHPPQIYMLTPLC